MFWCIDADPCESFQVFDDAVEVQKFFITLRDKLCKNGESFSSPAISYTHRHLSKSVEEETERKAPDEAAEDATDEGDSKSKVAVSRLEICWRCIPPRALCRLFVLGIW